MRYIFHIPSSSCLHGVETITSACISAFEETYISEVCNQCCTPGTYSHGNEKCGLAVNSHKFAFELMRSLTSHSATTDNIVISPFRLVCIALVISSFAEEDWHMPIESYQYLIILLSCQYSLSFRHISVRPDIWFRSIRPLFSTGSWKNLNAGFFAENECLIPCNTLD